MHVSVLMPVRNGAEFLARSAGSVCDQTYDRWELLIGVNGHAADSGVLRHARSFESPQTKVFDLGDPGGKAAALNVLVAEAQGDAVAILDVDDLWHPYKLERQVPRLRDGGCDVVGALGEYFGEGRGSIPIKSGPVDDYALFQPVDARAVALACRAMRDDRQIAGFALTWQPPDPAGPYRGRAEMVVFPHWDYTVNLQAGIWRRQTLIEILRLCPSKIGMWELEQAASRLFHQRMPGRIMAGWNIARPADASGFVDGTTKTGWVFAYHNLMHQGAPDPRHAEFVRRQCSRVNVAAST